MNRTPKKITPDRIKDSILLLNYTSNIPYQILLGKFYDILTKKSNYILPLTPPNPQNPVIEFTEQPSGNGVTLGFGSEEWVLFNNVIKIQLRPYTIIFNCLDSYPSWDIYMPEVKKVLELFSELGHIIRYNSIQLRYISHFQNIDLTDIVRVDLTNHFDFQDISSNYRKVLHSEVYNIIINIANKLSNAQNPNSNEFLSVIDIAVTNDKIRTNNLYFLYELIDNAHTLEKKTYFKTLTQAYIDSLNPIY